MTAPEGAYSRNYEGGSWRRGSSNTIASRARGVLSNTPGKCDSTLNFRTTGRGTTPFALRARTRGRLGLPTDPRPIRRRDLRGRGLTAAQEVHSCAHRFSNPSPADSTTEETVRLPHNMVHFTVRYQRYTNPPSTRGRDSSR